MKNLINKHIVVGITGSIAAYKSAYLVQALQSFGAKVRVVMSISATKFITPLTFQALTNQTVFVDEKPEHSQSGMLHIELAKWAELIIIAPATADFIARLSIGRSDDLLTALCLASPAKITVAPAMNQQMWRKKSTKNNINSLKNNGFFILLPESGKQACGDIGVGRMLDPDKIVAQLSQYFETGLLTGKTIIITAGPTREPIDPMRYLSNRSSGKMGYALAETAIEMGANVELISGAVALVPPDKVNFTQIETATQMLNVTLQKLQTADWFIGTAAVADYRPEKNNIQKIKKTTDKLSLALTINPDILRTVANHKNRPILVVGFAAETENIIKNAHLKLAQKNIDVIIANEIGSGIGVAVDDNQVNMIWKNGNKEIGLSNKKNVARQILKTLAKKTLCN